VGDSEDELRKNSHFDLLVLYSRNEQWKEMLGTDPSEIGNNRCLISLNSRIMGLEQLFHQEILFHFQHLKVG